MALVQMSKKLLPVLVIAVLINLSYTNCANHKLPDSLMMEGTESSQSGGTTILKVTPLVMQSATNENSANPGDTLTFESEITGGKPPFTIRLIKGNSVIGRTQQMEPQVSISYKLPNDYQAALMQSGPIKLLSKMLIFPELVLSLF